jgi:putative ABC transport system permease protein
MDFATDSPSCYSWTNLLIRRPVELLSEREASRRFNTVVIASFALTAVLLAALGIYSVIAFSVASRVEEMAIRIALGAQRAGIIRLVVTSGAQLAPPAILG